MNKDEIIKLAVVNRALWHRSGFGLPESVEFDTENDLLAFANACEKIGMDEAAKICKSVAESNLMAYKNLESDGANECIGAIRKASLDI